MVLGRQHVRREAPGAGSWPSGRNPRPSPNPPGPRVRDPLPPGLSSLGPPSPIPPPPALLLLAGIYQAPTMRWASSRESEHKMGGMQAPTSRHPSTLRGWAKFNKHRDTHRGHLSVGGRCRLPEGAMSDLKKQQESCRSMFLFPHSLNIVLPLVLFILYILLQCVTHAVVSMTITQCPLSQQEVQARMCSHRPDKSPERAADGRVFLCPTLSSSSWPFPQTASLLLSSLSRGEVASSTHHGDRKPGSAWIPPLPRSGHQVLFISLSHSLSTTTITAQNLSPFFPGSRRSLLTCSSVFALPGTLLQTCPTQCHQRHEKDPVVPLLKPLQSFPGAFQNCPPPTPTPRLSWVFICVPSSLEALSRQWCCAASNSTIGADKLSPTAYKCLRCEYNSPVEVAGKGG